MNSLLDLDQILIDEDEKKKRINYLFELRYQAYLGLIRIGHLGGDSTELMQKYKQYNDELEQLGCKRTDA